MKNLTLIFVSLLAIFLFTNSTFSDQLLGADKPDAQDRTKTFAVGPGGNLKANINPGSITITPWDKDELSVKIVGIDDENLENVTYEQRGTVILIDFESSGDWSKDINFTFYVPSSFHLDLRSSGGHIIFTGKVQGRIFAETMGGDIKTQNLTGSIALKTMGGDVTTGTINGDLKISSNGGDITTEDLRGDNNSIHTMGGDIKVGNVASNINLKTYGGDIIAGKVGGNASAVTYGGNVSIGRASGGVSMNTYGGSLLLDGAEGKVNAETNGGNVTLKNIKGSVNAKTMGGDMSVDLNPDAEGSSQIESMSGKVLLSIPSTSKVSIEAEITLWSSSNSDYKIKSDFQADAGSYQTDDNEISASYTLNGGGHLIKIKTTNSDIVIKKR